MSHFKLVSSTKASDVIPVSKYVSEKTGITVFLAGVEGPLVNGFFCLATEAHDDDGLPQTLKYLIFLGSERYPYKGILDLLANRCLVERKVAWTNRDHTCYTVYTAGDAGMLTLLPIYLDHILWPTLTDEGFITEVHHINGAGEDAGVMYCEMQESENTAYSRCELQLLRAMYPESGYSSETGGIMKNLRTSTDIIKVRDFHKKFYRPENLTIVLTGQIKAEDVFAVLATVEDDIIAKRNSDAPEKRVKPWQTIPPRPKYGEFKVQWPADAAEDCGQVTFAWRGPLLTEQTAMKDLSACGILLRYLCDTAAAPLQRCLVEREDALVGHISYEVTENIASLIKIELDNVPIAKLESARDEVIKCLQSVCLGEDPVDMERLRRLLRKQLREAIARGLDSDPHYTVASRCIGDALYSQSEHQFISRLNPQIDLLALLKESPDYWLGLLKKYFSEDHVTVMGSPSIELQSKMAEEEKKRLEEQRIALGEAGLAEKAKQLQEAMVFNERPPPAAMLASVPPCKFKCHNMNSWSSDGEPCPHFDLKEVPVYARLLSLKTGLVYMNLIFDTSSVDESTRKWLPLHMNGLAECAVHRGDTLVPHEDVISATEQLIVRSYNDIGFDRSGNSSVRDFGNFVNIERRCEPQDYDEVVNHLYEVLYAAEITKERLLVFAQRLINDAAQEKTFGDKMMYDTLRASIYNKNSNLHWGTVLRQQKFLKELIEQLNAGGDSAEAALSEARKTFKNITQNLWLHLATDFERYKLSTEPWKRFGAENEITPVAPRLYWDAELLSGWGGGFVLGVEGLELCCMAQMSPGPLGYAIEDIAPLMVAINYFTQFEGPMWRIQGGDLSYGYAISTSPNEGRLIFSLYRATNLVAAYSKTKALLEEYLADPKFDDDLFASAKSTALFEVVENEECPADVVEQSLMNYLYRVAPTYNSDLICAVSEVTPEDAHAAAAKWFPSLFDTQQSKVAIVCHPTKVKDMTTAFAKMNVKLEAFESIEASHFNN